MARIQHQQHNQQRRITPHHSLPPPIHHASSDSEDDDDHQQHQILRDDEDEQERQLSLRFGEAEDAGDNAPPTTSSKKRPRRDETEKDIEKELTRKARKKREVFEAGHLTGPKGLSNMRTDFPRAMGRSYRGWKKRGQREDVKVAAAYTRSLMTAYKSFCYNMYPNLAFDDMLLRIEKFGAKKEVRTYLSQLRMEVRREYLESVYGKEKTDVMLKELEHGMRKDDNMGVEYDDIGADLDATAGSARQGQSDDIMKSRQTARSIKRRRVADDDDDEMEATFDDVEGSTPAKPRKPDNDHVVDEEEKDKEPTTQVSYRKIDEDVEEMEATFDDVDGVKLSKPCTPDNVSDGDEEEEELELVTQPSHRRKGEDVASPNDDISDGDEEEEDLELVSQPSHNRKGEDVASPNAGMADGDEEKEDLELVTQLSHSRKGKDVASPNADMAQDVSAEENGLDVRVSSDKLDENDADSN
eukprot:CAMPEP_0172489694 /NCGR_PEP_ID=MMETSP1066-20121228/19878_1 /TAXON_ID=671091 /ORGANISM="Coscinodiscus wailesii, Strain CCMP2513" /LENGTH=469 /DNA_ID=CAMNT_0013257753 /DNA_START=29 /DNA_END=1438 /DNA_ORIENTATION=+